MKCLIASAVLLSVVFSTGLPVVGTTTAFAAGKVSSSYRYLKGIGKVRYKSFEDTSRGIVLHDFNGDGYVDVGYGTGGHVRPNCALKPPGVCNSKCTYKNGCKVTYAGAEIFLNDRRGRLNLKTKQAFTGKPLSWRNGESLHVSVAYDPKMNGKSTLADITGDGRADWLLFNSGNTQYPAKTSIIQLRPTGKLKVGPRKMPLITYHSGSLADIDNDGDLDLVWSLDKSFISYNNGRGKFTCENVIKGIGMVDYPPYKKCFDQLDSNQPILHKNGWSYAALVIDLDKDGLPEVITANGSNVGPDLKDPKPQHSAKIFVFKNTGGKLDTFKKVQTIPGPGKWPDQKGRKFSVWAADTQAADLDGDGDLDGLFYHECGDFCSGTNPIVILKNLGNGKAKRWQIINASPARGSYVNSDYNKLSGAPQVVDLNGDSRPDLVGNYSHNYNGSMKDAHKQIWMNKGNGKFKRLTTKIFAKVSGNSRKAKIIALHANKDKKIDWLVIWSDGTYGTLIAR
jgi:hypothetical protein